MQLLLRQSQLLYYSLLTVKLATCQAFAIV